MLDVTDPITCPLHEDEFVFEDTITLNEGDPQTAPDAALYVCPVRTCTVRPEVIR